MSLSQEVINYIEGHQEETKSLLKELAQIPAPSYHEEKRVAFCVDWLKRNGVQNVYTDEVLNVICPFGNCKDGSPIMVFMAHSDVVFPDMDNLPLHIDDDRLCCPGIGDNSMHVVHMLMAARYLTEKKLQPKQGGVLLVINSCEEGLGNLRGSHKIIDTFGDRITEFYSLDSKDGKVCDETVGSKRYRVEVLTEGGHSFGNFGNRNAIVYLASLIDTLYQLKVPESGKNTYNVGVIQGGTSVNTIAQQAEMLYEIRSNCRESLNIMDEHFKAAVAFYQTKGIKVSIEMVGERPCKGDVDMEKQKALAEKAAAAVRRYFDLKVRFTSGSTDCNIPLSRGIPAVNTGCYVGYGTHTREESVEISSICPSQKVAFDLILDYFNNDIA
jgi:di/tripeptidase